MGCRATERHRLDEGIHNPHGRFGRVPEPNTTAMTMAAAMSTSAAPARARGRRSPRLGLPARRVRGVSRHGRGGCGLRLKAGRHADAGAAHARAHKGNSPGERRSGGSGIATTGRPQPQLISEVSLPAESLSSWAEIRGAGHFLSERHKSGVSVYVRGA